MTYSFLSPSGSVEGHGTARGLVDFRTGQSEAQIRFDFRGDMGVAAVILDPPEVYYHYPPAWLALPGGKEWLRLDWNSLAGVTTSDALTLRWDDPSQYVHALRATGSVHRVGTETLFGVETTHYSAVIDRKRVAVPATFLPWTGPVDVWVDPSGIVRRLSIKVRVADLGTTSMTTDLFDFGTHVVIAPPPDSQTTDYRTLLAGDVPEAPIAEPREGAVSSRGAWAKQANLICGRALDAISRLGKPTTTEAKRSYIAHVVQIAEWELTELAALPRPAGVESQRDELVHLIAKEVSFLQVGRLASIFGGSKSQIQALTREAEKVDARGNRISMRLGAAECAQEAGAG